MGLVNNRKVKSQLEGLEACKFQPYPHPLERSVGLENGLTIDYAYLMKPP